MLCTKCGKRPAAVHMKQRLNGQEIEEYLCEECAESLWSFGTLDLNKLFSSHFAAPRPALTCPNCGMSLGDFNNSGRRGPSVADEQQFLQNPELANKNYEKLALQRQLNELVAVEKFEEAAAVRDKIRALEQEINAALNTQKAGEQQ